MKLDATGVYPLYVPIVIRSRILLNKLPNGRTPQENYELKLIQEFYIVLKQTREAIGGPQLIDFEMKISHLLEALLRNVSPD